MTQKPLPDGLVPVAEVGCDRRHDFRLVIREVVLLLNVHVEVVQLRLHAIEGRVQRLARNAARNVRGTKSQCCV